MTHKYAPVLAAIVLACPQSASALALGELRVRSNLNEPLDAEIELLPGSSDELADLRAALASAEEFRRAGVERPYVLTRLRFRIEDRPGGKAAIRVSTKQPVREPFLNFLLELNWPQGRLVREYTALLDPPVYSAAAAAAVRGPVLRSQAELPPAAPQPAVAPSQSPAIGVAEPSDPGSQAVAPPAPPAPESASSAPAPMAAETYGPVAAGDTLWAIATRVRPDRSVSPQQMMLALLRANPEAFVQGNVNALRAGYVLRIPDRSVIEQVDQAQAIAEIRRQQTLWEDYRQGVARSPRSDALAAATTPASRPLPPDERPSTPPDEVARLEIVAADRQSGSAGAEGAAAPGDRPGPAAGDREQVGLLRKEVTLLQEELDGRRQEVSELQARLAEAEALIQDLQRLITLKDQTLAALQQQALLTQEAAEAGRPAPVPEVREPAHAQVAAAQTPLQETDAGQGAPAGTASTTPSTPFTQAPDGEPGIPAPAAPAPGMAAAAGSVASGEVIGREPATPGAEGAAAEQAVDSSASAPGVPEPAAASAAGAGPTPAGAATAGAVSAAPPGPAASPKPAVAPGQVAARPARPLVALPEAPASPSLLDSVASSSPMFWGGLAGALALVGGLMSLRRRRPAQAAEPTAFADEPSTTVAARAVTESASESSLTESRASRPATPEPGSESSRSEDPMAEVNVYLAYERFDQAEEVVRKAIAENPDRPELRLKLLEVHHAAKDADAFRRDAQALSEAVGEASPLMQRARTWWSELAPGQPLALAGAAALAGSVGQAEDEPELERTLVMSVDDLRPATAPSALDEERAEIPSGELDFDLGLEAPPSERTSEPFDFDLDLGEGAAAAPGQATPSALDLDLSPEPSLAHAVAEATEALDLDLDAVGGARRAEPGSDSLGLDLEVVAASGPQGSLAEAVDLDLDAALEGQADRAQEGSTGTVMDLSLEPLSGEVAASAEPFAATLFSPPGEDSGFGIEPDLASLGSTTPVDEGRPAGSVWASERAEGLEGLDREPPLADDTDALVGTYSAATATGGSDPGAFAGSEPVVFTGTVPLADALGAEEAVSETGPLGPVAEFTLDSEPAGSTGTVPLPEVAPDAGRGSPPGASTLTLFGPYLNEEGGHPGAASPGSSDGSAGLELEPPPGLTRGGEADAGDAAGVAFEADAFAAEALSEPAGDALAEPGDAGGVPEEVFATLVASGPSALAPDASDAPALPPEVDFELDAALSQPDPEEASLFLAEGESGLEEVDTKLDLARAYIDMGDTEGARGILSEVLSEGNETQRDEAEELLTRLA